MKPIVIVGAGLAGWTVVRELRKLDKDVPLVMVAADSADFYAKPMLSNALAAGKTAEQLVQTPAATMATTLAIELRAHRHVTRIDRAQQCVVLDDGSELGYQRLALALGADPIRLPMAGNAAVEIVSINDLADYGRFRQKLASLNKPDGARLVILGAGLIGCEFANDLRSKSADGNKIAVSVFDPSPQALGRLLPPAAAEFYRTRLADAGIDFHFGESITSVAHDGHAYRLTASNGEIIQADLVLSAVGLRPRTGLASESGLSVGRGIRTDKFLATDDPAIFALGDCAEVVGLNLPFVLPIMNAARALAATLAGKPTAVVYPAMPVVVKTPACPTVVAPPVAGVSGQWQEERLANGVRSLFRADDGALLGFALCGDTVTERQALTKELPATLA